MDLDISLLCTLNYIIDNKLNIKYDFVDTGFNPQHHFYLIKIKTLKLERKEKLINSDKIGYEFADVLITTLLLADTMEIDIAKELKEKIEKIKSREY